MNVLLRCDIGADHGLGHAVRCKALAHELAAHGASVSFITTTPALEAFVAPFSCQFQSKDYQPVYPDVFVVDTKDSAIQVALDSHTGQTSHLKIVRIDHPYATPQSCHLLVGPVNHWDAETVHTLRTSFGDRFLYGWDYVMLAPEVTQQPPIPYAKRVHGPIVFCAGGSDPTSVRDRMWQWVDGISLDVPCYFSTAGDSNAYRDGLREAALVVGMFGVTTYECLWYQTPQIVFSRTSADILGAHELQAQDDHLCSAAFFEAYTPSIFCGLITDTYLATVRRVDEMPTLIDGCGTQRVADAILRL